MNGARIYLDHAATTPCREEVIAAMVPLMAEPGNAGSSHSDGRRVRNALDDARAKVAHFLGARQREIVFTAGGSEADTLAIVGVARALRDKGRHIVTVATEHHAVLHAADTLRDEGWELTVLGVDAHGQVDSGEFAASLRRDTVLASVMHANNEIGVIAPVAELSRLARERGALFHTDAVQAVAYEPLDVAELGVDLLSISAHKFYGPKGVGALYVRTGTPIAPIVVGGGQEAGLRAGTENVPGVAGLAVALELAVGERATTAGRMRALRDTFEGGVRERIPNAVVHGGGTVRLPNNSNIGFPGVDRSALLVGLDLAGISASAGSACNAGSPEPSHVIDALGAKAVPAAIRFSLGRCTTREEIETVLALLPGIVAQAREFPVYVGTT
jgi:cysteine desulfurase